MAIISCSGRSGRLCEPPPRERSGLSRSGFELKQNHRSPHGSPVGASAALSFPLHPPCRHLQPPPHRSRRRRRRVPLERLSHRRSGPLEEPGRRAYPTGFLQDEARRIQVVASNGGNPPTAAICNVPFTSTVGFGRGPQDSQRMGQRRDNLFPSRPDRVPAPAGD